jgi:hypothetical protein
MKNNILKLCLALVIVMIMVTPLYATHISTCTETYTHFGSGIYELILDWMSSSSSTFTTYTTTTTVKGEVLQAVTYTDSAGDGAKTLDNYDITVTAADGTNLFGSALSNRDSLNTEIALPQHITPSTMDTTNFQPIIDGKLTIAIANIGADSTTGRIVIFWRAK